MMSYKVKDAVGNIYIIKASNEREAIKKYRTIKDSKFIGSDGTVDFYEYDNGYYVGGKKIADKKVKDEKPIDVLHNNGFLNNGSTLRNPNGPELIFKYNGLGNMKDVLRRIESETGLTPSYVDVNKGIVFFFKKHLTDSKVKDGPNGNAIYVLNDVMSHLVKASVIMYNFSKKYNLDNAPYKVFTDNLEKTQNAVNFIIRGIDKVIHDDCSSVDDMADMGRFSPMKKENREIFQQTDKGTIANIEAFIKNVDRYLSTKDVNIAYLLKNLYDDVLLDFEKDCKDFDKSDVLNHLYYKKFNNAINKIGNNKIQGIKPLN